MADINALRADIMRVMIILFMVTPDARWASTSSCRWRATPRKRKDEPKTIIVRQRTDVSEPGGGERPPRAHCLARSGSNRSGKGHLPQGRRRIDTARSGVMYWCARAAWKVALIAEPKVQS